MQGNVNIPDSTITSALTFRNLVLMNMQQLTNFPYIEKDFDALTDYELLCLVVKYLNDVIDNQNDQNDSITNMYNAFLALQTYVNETKDTLESAFNSLDDYVRNYFDNLDVQDEINNKLDDMLEDGVLEQIIEQFLQLTSLICFDNVAGMKASINLANGSYARTLGYYSLNDGGSALYKIRTITNDDIVNEMDIIELQDNTLIAEYIKSSELYVKQFGVYADGEHDDSDNYQYCINYAHSNNIPLVGKRAYSLISKTLKIPVPINIKNLYLQASETIGNFSSNYMVYLNTTNGSTWDSPYNSFTDSKIEDIKLYNPTTTNILNGIKSIANIQINNIWTRGLNRTLDSSTSYYIDAVQMKNIMISHKTSSDYCIEIGLLGDMTSICDGHIYDTEGDNYFIKFNGSHKPSKIENIINGIISLNYGNISLSNYHGEGDGKSYILLNNGSFSLDTLHITDNKPCIRLDNANASINNFTSVYNYDISYTTDNDISLSNNSNVILTNSQKDILVAGQATQRLFSKIKTNVTDLNYIKNEIISTNTNEHINTKIFNIVSQYTNTSIRELSSGTWQSTAGTYYYKLCPYYDRERGIRSNYPSDRNITLGDNAHAIQFEGVPKNLPIRIMRGTQEGTFTHYVDLLTIDPYIRDNGNIVNGKKWESFPEAVTAFNGDTGYAFVQYRGNNIITQRNSAPGAGTWTKGDIVYNNSPTSGGVLGWICIEAGTPGTWKSLSIIG